MGFIPHIFEKLKLNNNKVKKRIQHSLTVNNLHRHESSIYTKSIIVNDIAPKTMGENFTFIDKNELDYNY